MMTHEKMRALAKRFFDCLEAVDIDGLFACYAPDATIWHNVDEREKPVEGTRKALEDIEAHLTDRVYDDRRVEVFDGGFVQQHVLRGTRVHDGVRVSLPVCAVCTVKDDRIVRIREYFDSARAAEFRKSA